MSATAMSYNHEQVDRQPIIPGEALLSVPTFMLSKAFAPPDISPELQNELDLAFAQKGVAPYDWMSEPEESEAQTRAHRAEFEIALLEGWLNSPSYDAASSDADGVPDELIRIEVHELMGGQRRRAAATVIELLDSDRSLGIQ